MNPKWTFLLICFLVIARLGSAQTHLEAPSPVNEQDQGQDAGARINFHDPFTQLYWFRWDSATTTWKDTIEYQTRTYSPNGVLSTIVVDKYFDSPNAYHRQEYYWCNADGLDTTILYRENPNGIWDTLSKSRLYYNSHLDLERLVVFTLSSSVWDSVYQFRNLYTYDLNNQMIERIRQSNTPVQDTIWSNNKKFEYTFNPNFEWTSITEHGWSSAWIPTYRTIDLAYHDFPKRLTTSDRHQDYVSGNWVDRDRSSTSYGQFNSNIRLYEEYTTSWDTITRATIDFDLHEHLVFSQEERWDSIMGWSLWTRIRVTNTYDMQGRLMEVVYEWWEADENQYENWIKGVIGSFFTGMEEARPAPTVQAWPNPTATELRLKLENMPGPMEVRIMDMQGRLRMKSKMNWQGEELVLPVSGSLENGTYIWQVIQAKGKMEGKFLIQR
jgi:hypothetical protein